MFLAHILTPFIYNGAYRVGAWLAKTFSPSFALTIMWVLIAAWVVFIAAGVLYIWGWRPKKKKSVAENERGSK